MEENKIMRIDSKYAWFELEELCEGCIYATIDNNEISASIIDFSLVPPFRTFAEGHEWIHQQIKKMEIATILQEYLEPINTNRIGDNVEVIFQDSIRSITEKLLELAENNYENAL